MYIERDIRESFEKITTVYNIVAVVGPRQAGKTTFLKQEMKKRNASYVLFDDPDARGLFEEDVKKFEKQYVVGYDVAVLDEVQYCRDAGTKLKYLAEKGHRIWLTSSSEILLGKEILSYLVGRVSILRLYPFSLPEFLDAAGQKEVTPEILRRNVWEHMTYGGYPKAVLAKDAEMKKTILSDLYETMILKDVARTFSIEDIQSLEDLVKYLAVNTGSVMSYESVSSAVKISFQTLRKYLDALEKSYIILRVPPYHTNKSKEITKQPKIYFLDTGLRNSVVKSYAADPGGKEFENYVACELLKTGLTPKYWRTKSKAEVDYVIEKDGAVIPIEVKKTAEEGKIGKGMHSFIEAYKPKNAFIVSYGGQTGIKQVGGCAVTYTDALTMQRKILVA